MDSDRSQDLGAGSIQDESEDSQIEFTSAQSAFDYLGLDNDESVGSRLRITGLFITINTQLTTEKLSVNQFETYLNEVLFTKRALPRLLQVRDDDLVDIQVIAPAIEIGDRLKRVHAHFSLFITHTTKIILSKGWQRRWQNFITMTLPVNSSGVYVQIQLLDTSKENYVLKNQYINNVLSE